MAETSGAQPEGGRLDRDAATRMSETALDEAWGDPGSLLLRVREGEVPVRPGDGGGVELDLVPSGGERTAEHCYLGRVGDVAMFCAPAREDDGFADPAGGWQPPFLLGDALSPLHIELMMVAFALLNWHLTMPFSPRDGGRTAPAQGGWARVDELGGEHFPRTDPAVIVLVEHEDRLLLGSNVLWETGRFSLLAGFVEAGENAEHAVVREVEEEAGVRVEQVRYVSSQAWPFPRSLMLGFRARLAAGADPAELRPDPTEISELRWFTRDELREPHEGLKLPMSLSIARKLIDLWVGEGDGGAHAGVRGGGVSGG